MGKEGDRQTQSLERSQPGEDAVIEERQGGWATRDFDILLTVIIACPGGGCPAARSRRTW